MFDYLKENLEVILITYNRRFYLEKTLKYILSKNSPIKECCIKILDNASDDGTSEVIEEYKRNNRNIEHIRNNRNIGGCANIVRAYEIATKEYVWVLCDDDEFDFSSGFEDIENAMKDGYDFIFTQKVKNNLSDIFYCATFVPSYIYKTANLDYTIIENMYDSIGTLFPHLALCADAINKNRKIFFPKYQLVNVGFKNCSIKTYVRGLKYDGLPKWRQNIYWSVGYLSSIELIKNRKKQIEIIDGLRHGFPSLYSFFKTKILLNLLYYGKSSFNMYILKRNLSLSQKIKFYVATIQAYIEYYLFNNDFLAYNGKERWIEYFKYVKEQKYINKLVKKYKNKKVLIYGAGTIGEVIFENYDISGLNIIAVSDKKFTKECSYKGYKAIPVENIKEYKPDVIIFTLYSSKKALESIKELYSDFKYISIWKRKLFVRL